jgi:hypothetical protein
VRVRNYVRDSRGRFSGNGVLSRPKQPRPPAKGGSITRALRAGQRELYKGEQQKVRNLGGNVAGMRIIRRDIKAGAAARMATPAAKPAAGSKPGKVSDALRGTLRNLAQADARYYREMGQILGQGSGGKKAVKGSSKPKPKRLKGS